MISQQVLKFLKFIPYSKLLTESFLLITPQLQVVSQHLVVCASQNLRIEPGWLVLVICGGLLPSFNEHETSEKAFREKMA